MVTFMRLYYFTFYCDYSVYSKLNNPRDPSWGMILWIHSLPNVEIAIEIESRVGMQQISKQTFSFLPFPGFHPFPLFDSIPTYFFLFLTMTNVMEVRRYCTLLNENHYTIHSCSTMPTT